MAPSLLRDFEILKKNLSSSSRNPKPHNVYHLETCWNLEVSQVTMREADTRVLKDECVKVQGGLVGAEGKQKGKIIILNYYKLLL